MQNLALFGGSFDPVHLGHLLVAEAAREELSLSRLFLIPAAQSPFKPERQPTPAKERLALLRLALAGKEWCEIDEQEIKRGGVSYTIDTVRDYARRFPQARLFYLIGADHVPQLPKWRQAEELARLAEFVVIPRPGESSLSFPAPFRGRILTGFPLGVSSSQIRERVRAGLQIEHLVPTAVAEAIRNNRLYL
jgi:nicotinate-nucleotide adenylyltransferase